MASGLQSGAFVEPLNVETPSEEAAFTLLQNQISTFLDREESTARAPYPWIEL